MLEGACNATAEGCITSPNWPAKYGDGESCTIVVATDVSLRVQSFDTEAIFDVLSVDGVQYSGSGQGPEGQVVHAGQVISWVSDTLVYHDGWHICGGGALPRLYRVLPRLQNAATQCVLSVANGFGFDSCSTSASFASSFSSSSSYCASSSESSSS